MLFQAVQKLGLKLQQGALGSTPSSSIAWKKHRPKTDLRHPLICG
jgi:hypothetical protein